MFLELIKNLFPVFYFYKNSLPINILIIKNCYGTKRRGAFE